MNLKPVHRKLFGQRYNCRKKSLLKQNILFTLKKFNGELKKDAKLSKFTIYDI